MVYQPVESKVGGEFVSGASEAGLGDFDVAGRSRHSVNWTFTMLIASSSPSRMSAGAGYALACLDGGSGSCCVQRPRFWCDVRWGSIFEASSGRVAYVSLAVDLDGRERPVHF